MKNEQTLCDVCGKVMRSGNIIQRGANFYVTTPKFGHYPNKETRHEYDLDCRMTTPTPSGSTALSAPSLHLGDICSKRCFQKVVREWMKVMEEKFDELKRIGV